MASSRAEVIRGLSTGAVAELRPNGQENPGPGVARAAALPTLRGCSHAIAFLFAVAAAIVVVALAPTARATVGLGVYGAALVALFGGSALYHRWRGPVRFKAVLQRIDHSTIFIFIAATMTPIALVILHGALAWVTLAIAWTGAAAGVAFSLGWVNAPRALTAGSYLLLGWVAVIMVPQVLGELTITPLLLLAAGGLLYSGGRESSLNRPASPIAAQVGITANADRARNPSWLKLPASDRVRVLLRDNQRVAMRVGRCTPLRERVFAWQVGVLRD